MDAVSEAKRMSNRERCARAYMRKVQERRCVICGRQDERTLTGRVHCLECYRKKQARRPRQKRTPEQQEIENESRREWEARRVELQLCAKCGAKDKNTVNGHRLCLRCTAMKRVYAANKYDPERRSEYIRKRRDRFRAEGRCTRCGGKREDANKAMCVDCRVRARLNRRRRQANQAGRDGNG